MNKYFINYELKISSVLIIFIMMIFLASNWVALKIYHDNLKSDYINSVGVISAKVVENHPELEKEIMPLVTKGISMQDVNKGQKFLSKYGVTRNLENELFPYMKDTMVYDNTSIIILFMILTSVLFSLNLFQHVYFYKRIKNLTSAAKEVVDGHFDISINENAEGDYSKLASAFNKMKGVIRNNINDLKKEKNFLVEILSDISHQLKTPLASMIIYNDILLDKELSKDKRDIILLSNQEQLNRMRWLIQSILKLARLDANAITFEKENFCVNETIQNSIDALEMNINKKNIRIIFKDDIEVFFEHDILWLEEAFINLIKNCIEHTEAFGKIIVELLENPIYIRVIIEDNGEGINEKDLPNIFNRFYKGKTSIKSDSVGIGLALSKSIFEAHNGTIEVHSKIGVGTKFIITFLKY